jgi:hypothetical protein
LPSGWLRGVPAYPDLISVSFRLCPSGYPCFSDSFASSVIEAAHEGKILDGTKTDHGEPDAGRVVPVPATLAWMLEAQINLNGPDCQLLFPTPRGRLWRERTFYRDLWKPAREPPA